MSAALAEEENIVVFHEDIGRHNALDKVIGEALIKGLDMKKLLVLFSGRISSEIVSKVEKIQSAFVVLRGAPTYQTIQRAQQLHMTLIGFARGERMNIYSARECVL